MKATTHKTRPLRFRYWSRKSYAVFLSIGKQVTIGRLKAEVTDAMLGKQSSSLPTSFANCCNANPSIEAVEAPPDSPLNLHQETSITTLQKPVAAPAFATRYSLYSMLSASIVGSIFLFIHQLRFMKKQLIAWAGLICFAATSSSIQAQETTLDDITITSSLTAVKASQTGRNVLIIKGETFHQLPVHSLDELLKYVPGIEVQTRGPQGSQSDISMRGGTYQQVLVVLDGLRLNDPNTGHFTAYIPITPAQIDRIEILKGASAAIYGSDAVGGVINIITKTATTASTGQDTKVTAQIAAGAHILFNTSLGGYTRIKKLTLDAGLLSNHADGFPLRGTEGYLHNTTASLGARLQLNQHWTITSRTAYDHRDFSAQNFYTAFSSDTATEQVKGWWQQLGLNYQHRKHSFQLQTGYKNMEDQYAYNKTSIANKNQSSLLQATATYQQKMGANTLLTTGINYQHRQIISNDRGNHQQVSMAPFITVTQQLGSYVKLMPSLRVESFEGHPLEWLPQLNASFHYHQWQLRASGGRSIRDADFTEKYNNYNKPIVKSGSVGNPWLVPEIGWNYEAGIDWLAPLNLKLATTFFQRIQSRLIDWTPTAYQQMPRQDNLTSTGTYALAKNIAAVTTTGWETDLQFQHQWQQHQLIVNGGILWLDSKTSEAQPSFYLSSHARFMSNFNLQYVYKNAAISFTGIYKFRNPQQGNAFIAPVSQDYFLLNGRISYAILKNKLQVFVQADNIFDQHYSDLLGAVMPGRWLQAGVRWQWIRS